MGNSSSASPWDSKVGGRSRREVGDTAATVPSSSTTSCTSSFSKTVLLHDWWLINVEDECSRPRLGVGGVAITGKVVRIFKSAPIVKRHDGYTLETADGFTVRIQGLINASRMCQNGFPSQACNHFRIGFPYCWKYYADRYFQTDTKGNGAPTCASDIHIGPVDSANTASYCFPVYSKEFPISRIVECLNSICKDIADGGQSSADTAQNLCKNNDYMENTNGTATQADGNIVVSDGNINVAEENAYMSTNTDAWDGLKQVAHVSSDSLLCRNMDSDNLLEEVTGFQTLATAVAGPDNEKQQFGHGSSDVDGLVEDIDGNTCINTVSAVDSGHKVLSSKSLPETREESLSIAPDENHAGNETEQVVHLSVPALSHKPDVEHMNTPRVELQIGSLNPVSCDTVCTATIASNSFNSKHMANRHILVSQNSAGMNCNQGESGGFSHLDGARVCSKNMMDLEVSYVTGNSSHMASYHTLSHHSDKNTVCSVATEVCSSIFINDVNDRPENCKMRVTDNNMMGLGSGEVHAECSYNEANDLQPESSNKMPIHTSYSLNSPSKIDIRPEENNTGLPHVGMTLSECPNKQFSLRRSERLAKLRNPAEDTDRSLEHNKRNLHKAISKSVADGTQNMQGSTLNLSEGTSVARVSPMKSADINAMVARKLNLSLHKSLDGYSITSNEDKMLINLEENNISVKKHVVTASQEKLLTSQGRCDGPSQKKSKNGSNKNSSAVDTGKNRVLSFSDGCSFVDSENTVRGTHDLTGNRIEADAQNLDMPTGEQSNSCIGVCLIPECAKKAHQLIEGDMQNLHVPTREESVSCVAEYAEDVCQPDAHVNAQPHGGKLNLNEETSVTQVCSMNSADINAVVARKLNFHKSLDEYSITSNKDKMHINLDGNTISVKKHVVRASQEELVTSQAKYDGHSQKKSKDGSNKNSSVVDTGKNQVLSFSDGGGIMDSENTVRGTHDLTGNRIEADAQNLDMPTGEQSTSCIGMGLIPECAKKVHQLIEADMQNLDLPTREQINSSVGISCVGEYAEDVCQPDAHVNAQPHVGKSSVSIAMTSTKRSHFSSQVENTPFASQRTKTLSLASPELSNLKRSRSGRLLVPTLSNWCQQIIYDADGSVAGILTGVDATKGYRRGTRSEPHREKEKEVIKKKKKVI